MGVTGYAPGEDFGGWTPKELVSHTGWESPGEPICGPGARDPGESQKGREVNQQGGRENSWKARIQQTGGGYGTSDILGSKTLGDG